MSDPRARQIAERMQDRLRAAQMALEIRADFAYELDTISVAEVEALARLLHDAEAALTAAEARPQPQELEAVQAERDALELQLRQHLWINHGHPHVGLYGDDGEMQCSLCAPAWDYKRMPLERLQQNLFEQRMKALSDAQHADTVAAAEARGPHPQDENQAAYVDQPARYQARGPVHARHEPLQQIENFHMATCAVWCPYPDPHRCTEHDHRCTCGLSTYLADVEQRGVRQGHQEAADWLKVGARDSTTARLLLEHFGLRQRATEPQK